MAEYSQPDSLTARGTYWRAQLDHAEKLANAWEKRGEKVVKRYRDERDAIRRAKSKFNILWSNVQVLSPSLYGRAAKPEVSRRFMDSDPVGRLASTMLERVLDYEVQQFPDYNDAMEQCVEDRLLPGRGTAWIRYVPTISTETMEAPEGVEITNTEDLAVEHIDAAHSPVDYIYWKDFLHSPARTWDEVWWAARIAYMTKEEGVERFGETFALVPLSEKNEDAAKNPKENADSAVIKKAKVYEIWDKSTGKVCWVAKGYTPALDEQPDPLQLEGFFPCPRPLFATTTNGSLTPVPDYCEYQDQAEELDSITNRISVLVEAVRATGVFNAEFKELARLFTEGYDNRLIPVKNWAALSEKNGLKGAIDMLDIATVLQALGALYAARESVKQTIYEICGISDILRGATNAQETLGAQQLKANFGSLRLRRSQADVARFATDLFRLKAQVICKFYPPDLIVQMSGIASTLAPDEQALLPQALQLLSNSTIRDFHIAVESDSLAQIDDQEEKQAATEAITAIATFLRQAGPMVAQAPETLPMVSEMLLFLVRRYRAGRSLESAIERAMKALEAKAAAAQQQQPHPEQIKAEAQAQVAQVQAQASTQAAQMKAQFDSQVQQGKLQQEAHLEKIKAQQEERIQAIEARAEQTKATAELNFKRWEAMLKAKVSLRTALIGAKSKQVPTGGDDQELEIGLDDVESNLDPALSASAVPEPKPKPQRLIVVRQNQLPMRHRILRDASGKATDVISTPTAEPADTAAETMVQ